MKAPLDYNEFTNAIWDLSAWRRVLIDGDKWSEGDERTMRNITNILCAIYIESIPVTRRREGG